MSGYSGAQDPGGIKIEEEETKKIQELWSKEQDLTMRLGQLCLDLDALKSEAKEAFRARDAYCASVAKKYGIKEGASWDVNFEKSLLVVLPTKPIVKTG